MLLLCLVVLSANCQKNQSSSYNISNSGDGKLTTHHMTINADGNSLEIKYAGEVRFNDNETAIQSLDPKGGLFYRKNDQKLIAEIDNKGNIVYEMYDGSTKLSIETAAGKQFLANIIKDLVNHGIDAKGSVERLYKKGGSSAVLNRVETLKSDYAKGIYLDHLLQQPSLASGELSTIAEKAGTLISSDYEKAKVLSKSTERFMAEPKAAQAYFAAAKTINSDYEKAKVLKGVLAHNLSTELYDQAISLTRDIHSDYEKAGVAIRLIEKGIPNKQAYDQLIKVSGQINSDYEQARVLKRLLDQPVPAGVDFEQVLGLLNNIASDYEKAGVLKKISNKELSPEQWVSLIQATSGVSSNYEKSGVLVQIARLMPKTEKTEEAYRQAAKTVSSDYEFGKVMRALE